jgi:hypothetical protein
MEAAGEFLLCTIPVFVGATFRATALMPEMIGKLGDIAVLQARVYLLLYCGI